MIDDSDRRIADKICQWVDLNKQRVLEVGCGNGRITARLTGKPAILLAIDPDVARIAEARKAIPGADFCIGSGEALAFPAGCFDVVLFTLSLHHQYSAAALAEAARVLKPGGEVVVVEPSPHGELERVFALVRNEDSATAAAQQAIAECSLSVRRSETFHAKWVFDDSAELCRALFAHYGKPFDAETAQRIVAFLGPKANHRPLELTDTMLIQSLANGI